MDTTRLFSYRRSHHHEGQTHSAEVTIRAEPCLGKSQVILSEEVLSTLHEIFGTDFEHHRHCLWSGVMVQIDVINVKGHYPHAGASSFQAEVVSVRLSGNAGREVSGILLTSAGMHAMGEYLGAWENEQQVRS